MKLSRYLLDSLDALGIGVCEYDGEMRALCWNQTFLQIFPEDDGEIYRFVSNRPGDSPDPVLGITNRIGDEVSAAFRRWLEAEGLDPDPANIWGHGAVGYIWAVADRWILTDLRRPRAEVVAYVNQFFVPAFAAQTRKSA